MENVRRCVIYGHRDFLYIPTIRHLEGGPVFETEPFVKVEKADKIKLAESILHQLNEKIVLSSIPCSKETVLKHALAMGFKSHTSVVKETFCYNIAFYKSKYSVAFYRKARPKNENCVHLDVPVNVINHQLLVEFLIPILTA